MSMSFFYYFFFFSLQNFDHTLALNFMIFYASLHGHEENVGDEIILQDDEDNSNIDLDCGDEFD
jgi:hypothetical protein